VVETVRPEATAPILSEANQTMSQADNPPPASFSDPAATSPSKVSPASPGIPQDDAAVGRPSGRTWMMVLTAGLLAGLTGFGSGEYALRLLAPSTELPPGIKGDQTLARREHTRRILVSQDRIAASSYGVLGAALGLALGAAGGLSRRSPLATILAALVGLLLGAAAGAGTTFLFLPLYHAAYDTPSTDNATQQLGLALVTHGVIWMAIGAVAGLALGLGLGGGRGARAIVGGILGAAAAAVIYEFAGAVGFPLDRTYLPTALAPVPRLLAHLAVAFCVPACALWAAYDLTLRRRPVRERSPESS
jgi:hypothetical protein